MRIFIRVVLFLFITSNLAAISNKAKKEDSYGMLDDFAWLLAALTFFVTTFL